MATLGTVQEIRAELRQRLGYTNDTVLLPDPADTSALFPAESPLDVALRDALRAVNKHWPTYGVGSFQTVADQQAYTPLPAGGRELIEVFWSDQACDAALLRVWPTAVVSELETTLGDFVEGEGGVRLTTSPSALTILQRQRSMLRRYFGRSSVITDRNRCYLIPTPSSAGTNVYFVYSENRFDTVDEVTDDISALADAFWAMAEYKGHTILGTGAGAVKKVTGPDGTITEVDVMSHHRAASAAHETFVGQLGLAAEWWVSF